MLQKKNIPEIEICPLKAQHMLLNGSNIFDVRTKNLRYQNLKIPWHKICISIKRFPFPVLPIASLIWPLLDCEKFDEVYRRIAKLQSNLRRIAFQHKMSILIVNNAVNNGTRPALGKLFSKVANTRLFINKNNEITFEKFSPFDKLKQSVKIRMIINENGVTNIDNNV